MKVFVGIQVQLTKYEECFGLPMRRYETLGQISIVRVVCWVDEWMLRRWYRGLSVDDGANRHSTLARNLGLDVAEWAKRGLPSWSYSKLLLGSH
jgi:hypothetical protein